MYKFILISVLLILSLLLTSCGSRITSNNSAVTSSAQIKVKTSVPTATSSTKILNNSVLSTTNNSNSVSKIDSSSKMINNSQSVADDKTPKEVTIQGKAFNVKYQKTEKASGVQMHDRNNYIADDKSVADYDVKTGQLVYLVMKSVENNPNESTNNRITAEQATVIAQDYIKTQCDISKYTFISANYNEYTGYSIYYDKIFAGYQTTEGITVSITLGGEIHSFIYNPYVFDNIDPQIKIDETNLIKKLDDLINANSPDHSVKYTITNKLLAVNQSNQLQMQFSTSVTQNINSQEYSSGIVYTITI